MDFLVVLVRMKSRTRARERTKAKQIASSSTLISIDLKTLLLQWYFHGFVPGVLDDSCTDFILYSLERIVCLHEILQEEI